MSLTLLPNTEVNLLVAKRSQKTCYNKQVEFQPGQKVLLLLLSSNSKLLAKWQGPYLITHKMGLVTCKVYHLEKKNSWQTYHVNLLKEWKDHLIQPLGEVLQAQKMASDKEVMGKDGTVDPYHDCYAYAGAS